MEANPPQIYRGQFVNICHKCKGPIDGASFTKFDGNTHFHWHKDCAPPEVLKTFANRPLLSRTR
jgi:hypothetical protein